MVNPVSPFYEFYLAVTTYALPSPFMKFLGVSFFVYILCPAKRADNIRPYGYSDENYRATAGKGFDRSENKKLKKESPGLLRRQPTLGKVAQFQHYIINIYYIIFKLKAPFDIITIYMLRNFTHFSKGRLFC